MIELKHTDSSVGNQPLPTDYAAAAEIGYASRTKAIKWLHEKMFDKKGTSCVVVSYNHTNSRLLTESIVKKYPYISHRVLTDTLVWPNGSTVKFVSMTFDVRKQIQGLMFESYWLNNIGNFSVIADVLPVILERIKYIPPSGIITF